ncbi:DMT family transporter [Leucobacter chromiiresistens]|uniref:DMT family transporter n=1 Tax=Leucobacter chromiiresistens TaxID=1079994 RepID=UPI000AEA509C|nr:SMR family transporter [Leucobacter chromiiresistens]
MRAWIYLASAILLEVAGSMSLKGALDAPALYAAVAVGYVGSFVCLGKVLSLGMPLGVAYGIWGATGVALTAGLSTLVFREPFTALMGAGIVLIIGGVLLVELGSQAAQRRAAQAAGAAQAPPPAPSAPRAAGEVGA